MQGTQRDQTPEELEEGSTADLFREALDAARELLRIEVQLAREELNEELRQVRRVAMSFGVALAAAVLVLNLLAVALVLALGGGPAAALGVAGGFLVVGGVAAGIGYSMVSTSMMEKTRHRLESDVEQLKEHTA